MTGQRIDDLLQIFTTEWKLPHRNHRDNNRTTS